MTIEEDQGAVEPTWGTWRQAVPDDGVCANANLKETSLGGER